MVRGRRFLFPMKKKNLLMHIFLKYCILWHTHCNFKKQILAHVRQINAYVLVPVEKISCIKAGYSLIGAMVIVNLFLINNKRSRVFLGLG